METKNGFYEVEVGVCCTDRIMYDSIREIVTVRAKKINGRECIYPPKYPGGLFPGMRGDGRWIIRRSDWY